MAEHAGNPQARAFVTNVFGVTETEIEERRYKPAYPVDNSNKWPSGGLLSTPSDMLKLGQEMLDPRLIVLSIGSRSSEDNLLLIAERDHRFVDERAIVV